MSLKYAGTALTPLSSRLRTVMERWWDETAPDLWSHPGYRFLGASHLPLTPPKHERPRLGVLYWPTGTARWGIYHGLVGTAGATAIKTAVAAATAPISANLEITDGGGTAMITAPMYVIGLRPVFTQDASYSLYWIELVDARFYGWLKDPNSLTFADGDSWATLLTNLA